MAYHRVGRFLSKISFRLLAFNLLLVFLPAAGVLLLDTYEQHLLEAQERTMGQEGRLFAAALEATGRLDGNDARSILLHLGQRHIARLRVVDATGNVIADSSALGPRREPETATTEEPALSDRERPLYRIFLLPVRVFRWITDRDAEPSGQQDAIETLPSSAYQPALEGRYGATTVIRPTSGRDIVELHIAIPIRTGGSVAGAVVVSQSTWRVMNTLYAVRLDIARVVLVSLAVAAALSLLLGLTIARPLTRLRHRSEAILDRRGRLTGGFEAGDRNDEIGDLERALAGLSHRLEEHLKATRSLASDLSHEFKNPLASIRATTEVALDETDPSERQVMLETIQKDVARLERLLTGAREITSIEMLLEEEERDHLPLGAVIMGLRETFRRQGNGDAQMIRLHLPDQEIPIRAAEDRLLQVFENLLANAVSLTPSDGHIDVSLRSEDGWAVVCIEDDGPGIPEEHLDRVFQRFFSYRPETHPDLARGHMGLGLAIVKAIVEGYGGTVGVANREGGGAAFTVKLPLEPPD